MHRGGFFLPLVLILAVLCALVMTFTVLQQNRRQQVIRNSNEVSRFDEVNRRMSQILSAVHLCTCNLRDLVLQETPGGKQAVLVPSGAYRHHFGFYKLAPDSSCLLPDAIDVGDVVLNLSEVVDPSYAKAMTVDQITLDGFSEDKTYVNPTYKRYRGNFKFVASKNQMHSRTNQTQPVGIDIFVEVDSATNTIRQCYPPNAKSVNSGLCWVKEMEEAGQWPGSECHPSISLTCGGIGAREGQPCGVSQQECINIRSSGDGSTCIIAPLICDACPVQMPPSPPSCGEPDSRCNGLEPKPVCPIGESPLCVDGLYWLCYDDHGPKNCTGSRGCFAPCCCLSASCAAACL